MKATSTKGLTTFLSAGAAVTIPLTGTVSAAKPAVFTTDTTGLADGDLIYMENTGFAELDNQVFVAGSLTASEVELLGSDTEGVTPAAGATPTGTGYPADQMVLLCLATIVPNVDEPGVISVATFCDPSATIASAVSTAGTMTLTGFVDIEDPGYQELIDSENDGIERMIQVEMPSNGWLVAPLTVSSITWDLPIDGASGFSITAVLSTKLRHAFETV